MEQQAELKAKDDGLPEDFKRKVAAWEKAGVLDRIAGKIDKAIEEIEAGDAR